MMKKLDSKRGNSIPNTEPGTPQTDQQDSTQLMQALLEREPVRSSEKVEPVFGIVVGIVQSFLADGRVHLHVADLATPNIIARIACAPDGIKPGVAAAAMFEQGDIERALIIGAMYSNGIANANSQQAQRELTVDKQRIVIEAEQELELRCGEAAIVLTADGRILQRGNYISSLANATQRIRGGSVQIN